MALSNKEIYTIRNDLSYLLANLKDGQRSVIQDEPAGIFSHNWLYNEDGDFICTAISKIYTGSAWEVQDTEFKDVTLENLKDEYVTAGIPIGESGETSLDVSFSASSIVGALNELKTVSASEWNRVNIDINSEYLIRIVNPGLDTYTHIGEGLVDSFIGVTNPITIGDAVNTTLSPNFPPGTTSLYAALNYLVGISGGPVGVDGSIQFKTGTGFDGNDKFKYTKLTNQMHLYYSSSSNPEYLYWTAGDTALIMGIQQNSEAVTLYLEETANTGRLEANTSFDFEILNIGAGALLVNDVELKTSEGTDKFLNGAGNYTNIPTTATYPDILYYNTVGPETHTPRLDCTQDANYIEASKGINYTGLTFLAGNGFSAFNYSMKIGDWYLGTESGTDNLGLIYRATTGADSHNMVIGSVASATYGYLNQIDLIADKIRITNADGTRNLFDISAGGGVLTFPYRFETSTSAPPSSKRVRYNNATQASTTKIFIDDEDLDGKDVSVFLLGLKAGDDLIIMSSIDSHIYDIFTISAVTDQTDYVEYDVTYKSGSGADFTNSQSIIVGRIASINAVGVTGSLQYKASDGSFKGIEDLVYDDSALNQLKLFDNGSSPANRLVSMASTSSGGSSFVAQESTSSYIVMKASSTVCEISANSAFNLDIKNIGAGHVLINDVRVRNDLAATVYLDGTGSYSTPAGGGSGVDIVSNAYVSKTSTQSLSNGVETTIQYNDELYDDEGDWNIGNYEWVAPEDCTVLVSACAEISLGSNGQGEIRVYQDTGGGYSRIEPTGSDYLNTAGTVNPDLSFSLKVDSGDKLQFKCIQFSGFTATLLNNRSFVSIIAFA